MLSCSLHNFIYFHSKLISEVIRSKKSSSLVEISSWPMCNAKPLWTTGTTELLWSHWKHSDCLPCALLCFEWMVRVSKRDGMIIMSQDVATFCLWLTSGSGVVYWGALECVRRWLGPGCRSNGAKGMITLKLLEFLLVDMDLICQRKTGLSNADTDGWYERQWPTAEHYLCQALSIKRCALKMSYFLQLYMFCFRRALIALMLQCRVKCKHK